MKRVLGLLLLSTFIFSCAKSTPKVLLFIRDGSADLEYMLKMEAGIMKDVLERSGFKVVIVTVSGSALSAGSMQIQPDLKLVDVNVADYAGFIIPCMAAGDLNDPKIPAESVDLVRRAISAGKPVAAQLGGVWALAQAGLLKGKKYARIEQGPSPVFDGAIYSGTGVVKDGLVVTSGICPYMARAGKTKDGTEELTLALVETMKAKM
jgi:putative intracellular protease/amidase